MRLAVARGTIVRAVDEAKAGPRFVDRAHLVVDESVRESELAHDPFAQIGRDARSLFRPRDPKSTRGRDGARESVEATLQLRASRREEQDDILRAARLHAD